MTKMNCQKNELLLNRFIDGELSPDDVKDVSEHIENCLVCRHRAVQMQRLYAESEQLFNENIEEKREKYMNLLNRRVTQTHGGNALH